MQTACRICDAISARCLGCENRERCQRYTANPAVKLIFFCTARGQLQESEGFKLARTLQSTRVDGVETARLHQVDERGLGSIVITGDQHGGLGVAGLLGGDVRGEHGVERLEHVRLGEFGLQFGGCGAVGRHDERIEGGEVQRVGDIDDGLAFQLVAVLLGDGREGRVGDGEHDDVALDGRVLGVRIERLDGCAGVLEDALDCGSHVAGAENRDGCHGGSFRVGGCVPPAVFLVAVCPRWSCVHCVGRIACARLLLLVSIASVCVMLRNN